MNKTTTFRTVLVVLLFGFITHAQNIISISPPLNATSVPINANLSVTFDAVITPTVFSATIVRVTGSQTGTLSGTLSGVNTNTITFNPTNDFKFGEQISLSIRNSAGGGVASFTATVSPASPGVFANGQNTITTSADGAFKVYAADLDGDGDTDVLSASINDNKIAWYKNDGAGTFGNQIIITTQVNQAWGVFAADLDNDGDLDVISGSAGDDRLAWYANDGAGNFGAQQTITTDENLTRRVYAADIDGDGNMDVYSTSGNTNRVTWYRNNGNGVSWTQRIISTPNDTGLGVQAADVDNDGDLDFIALGNESLNKYWYENIGNGNFGTVHNIVTPTGSIFNMHTADLDNDGDLDMLFANRNPSSISWHENDGSGNFGAQQIITTAINFGYDVYAADIDGDGDMDVLSGSSIDNRIAWYQNDGTGSFGAQQTISTQADGATSIYTADLDGDGDLDVLSASGDDDRIAWYANALLFDTTNPVANCKNITIQLDSLGEATITAADVDNGSTDDSGTILLSIDITDFDCSTVGNNTVTLTVEDTNGNTATCTATVTVQDNIAPIANCAAPFTVQLDVNGEASITAAAIDNGSTDACGITSLAIDISDFDTSNIGPNTVTLTVTDENGNNTNCTTTVTVLDPCEAFTTDKVYVDKNATGNNDGTDWDNAFTDLQNGFLTAKVCSVVSKIYVAEGTYKPTSTIDRTISFELFPDVAIYGGFSPTNGAINLATRDFTAYPAILSGEIGDQTDISDNTYHVVFAENIGDNVILDGFTITKGQTSGNNFPNNTGAGIFLNATGNSSSSPLLQNLRMTENNAQYGGGLSINGINNSVISPTLTNCLFTENNAVTDGSGVYFSLRDSAITNINFNTVDFNNNTAKGAAISSFSADQSNYNAEYVNSSFSSNISDNRVGAILVATIFNTTTQNTLINCLFNNNEGRAMSVSHNGSNTNIVNITNCTFSENTTSNGNGGAISNYGATTFNITNSILWNNSPDELSLEAATTNISYSLIEGYDNATNNGLDGTNPANNPQFTDSANKNYTVLLTSPVIDLGDNTVVTETEDLAGNDRVKDSDGDGTATVEMGVYEAATVILLPLADFTGNGSSLGTAGCAPLIVDFVDTSTAGTSSTIIAWDWDFGDGNTSTLQNPTNVYDTPGNYRVSLIVTNSSNETDTEVKPNFVTVIGPEVDFSTSDPTTGCPPLTINFMDDTTATAPIISRLWDFGDGNTSTSVNPTHTYFSVGNFDVRLTVTDFDGCSRTETKVAFISTEDSVAPTINCPANITVSNDYGTCGAVVTYTAPVGTDNCSGATTVQTTGLASGEVFPVGITTNTFVVTDAAGLTTPCSFDVIVEDNVEPELECVDDRFLSTDPGVCTYTVIGTEFDATFTDNCSNGSITNNYNNLASLAGAIIPKGATTIYWTVDDGNGNTSTCIRNLFVFDTEDPTITCLGDITQDNDAGICGAVITYTAPTGTDNCTGVTTTQTDGLPSGSIFPIGTTTNTFVTTDADGNTANCSFDVTINDTEAPVSNCAVPFTIQLDAYGDASITVADIDNGSTDNCGIASTSIDITNFTCADVGVNTVTLTVTDVNGNASTCTTIITVEDTVAPITNCTAPFTIQLDATGNASITVADIENGSTDACGIASTSIDITDFTCADVGVNTVTLTVTDVNGNMSTCTTDVTVEDNVAPIANCAAPFTVQLDATGNASITVADIDNGSTDACGIASTSIDITDFTCADVGVNTVTLTVTDVNGNVSTCTTDVTVEDSIAPVIACSADVVANTDPAICGTVVIFSDAIALDNCGVASVVQTAGLPSGSLFPVGVSTIEYTATDVNGNTTTCNFTITVTDNEAPITVCQDITIQLDAAGNATIIAADVDGGSTDNCGIASTTIDMNTFDCSNVGPNNVTLTVTDVNGNVSTCIAVVTVEDVTEPVVTCMDITVQLDATGTVTIAGIDVDGGSTDACGIASYDLDIATFDCSNIGLNTVVLTVTDVNGNTATCTAVVTVEDITSPDLVCMDITLELGADGTATITADDVISSNTDACGIATTAVDITDFDCSDIGTPVTVQVFSQDANGNLATCFATVTVVDMFAPEITCPADQTQDPGAGNLFYEVPDYFATGEATVTDNCTDPVTITTQDPALGTLLPDGTHTITLTATDEYGNVGTCTFELIVESTLGVDEIELEIASVSLYPNPSSDYVYISNPHAIALEQVDIYDIRGRFIESIDLRTMGTEKQIDISTLASATYTVIIKYDQGQTSRRLLKE